MKPFQTLRLELEQLKLRVAQLEFKANLQNIGIDTSKSESAAKTYYNKVWSELTAEEKVLLVEKVVK